MKGSWDSMSIIAITSFFFFLFIIKEVFAAPPTRHLCRPEQRDALLQFKNKLAIGKCSPYDYPKTESWAKNSDCCNWRGIECDDESREVIKIDLFSSCLHSNSSFFGLQNLHFLSILDLSFNNLTGPIPSEIGELSHLTSLQLSHNMFSGPIHSFIGNLTHLTTLDLSTNQFSGPIPSSIGKLSRLTDLDLSTNQFSGQIPSSFGNLSHLTTLDLSTNRFSGQIPSSIGKLSRLTDLYLSSNQFSSSISYWTGNLSHLTTLFLSSNNFSDQIPSSIRELSRLTALSLSYNRFSGLIPSWIGKLSCLSELYLSSNHLSGPIPSSIGNLSYLRTFYLSFNQFSGQIPSSIGNLSFLTSLYLSYNQFSGHFPSSIGNNFQLGYLEFSNNKIKGQVPSSLWTLPFLEYLDLSNNSFIGFQRSSKHVQYSMKTSSNMKHFFGSNNNFMGKIPSVLCELRSLTTLDLSNNNFNGSIPICIGNVKSTLSYLNLRRNRLSGGLPEDMFESLKSLDVGHNQFVGKLSRSLINFTSLEVLNMESNKINDTFPFWLSSLKELKVLVLRSNLFHGPIHQALFVKLRIIDISHNYFHGALPFDFFVKWNAMSSVGEQANLTDKAYMGSTYYKDSIVLMNKGVEMIFTRILIIYTALDFSRNKFEGEIPKSIGILKELHLLNLSNNAFSGHIPSSMGKLTALESLDVSQNKLSGGIPQELGNLSYLEYMNFSHNQLEGLVPGGTQFGTQPCSSFEDNMGLFGPSLDEACKNIHTLISKKKLESEEREEEVISWIAALIGFGPGLVFGLTIGYILSFPLNCEWFMKRLR